MRQQAIRYTLAGTLGVVLAVVLVVIVNWLGARHYLAGDWTSSNIYSVSDKTRSILSDLGEDVRVVVFMTPASTLYDQVFELLNRYKALSGRISVEYIDPEKEPLKTRQLAEQFGVSVADTVVFAAGDRTKYVTSDQMADYDYAGMQYGQAPTMRSFKGEEQFTSAILSLVAPDVPKVYFVTGHGEASTTGGGGVAERSLATLAAALKRENIETADTSLLGGSAPEDADVLAIIGPTQAFTEAETRVLETFLEGGGRLLIALDPLIEPTGAMRPTRLEPFLAAHGIKVGNDLVIDPSRKLPFYDLSAVYLTDFPSHPVTRGLEGLAVLFSVARSVTPADDSDGQRLVETTKDGWGETNLAQLLAARPVEKNDGDTPGPVSLGVALAAPSPAAAEQPQIQAESADSAKDATADGWRMVVLGDSDFMSDFEIANAGNTTLALNAFNWLASRELSLGIPPRSVEQVSLFLSQKQLSWILLITLVGMPGAAIVLGIAVWRRRRH